MKIICASSVTYGKEAFSILGDCQFPTESEISPDTVATADALITRSKTQLNACLLGSSSVRFAGTCTAGIDHAHLGELETLGISFASAPGCNANAVSEYVIAALLESPNFTFEGKTVGIIGHGQVGTRVDHKLSALGCRILRNDPPKAQAGGLGPFVDLETLLRESDVVTLHVPLIEDGCYPTRNLLGDMEIRKLKEGAILINACRGEAIETSSLIQARKRNRISWLVLDVWDPEPGIPVELLSVTDIATPHIAGHSVEGKVNGTSQIRKQLCAHFSLEAKGWNPELLLPPPKTAEVDLNGREGCEARLKEAVKACYDIRLDDRNLREPKGELAERFVYLRRNYRNRREFSATKLRGLKPVELEIYRALGFCV